MKHPQQESGDLSERHPEQVDLLGDQMVVKVGVYFFQKVIDVLGSLLDSSETSYVVGGYVLQHLGDAPVDIRLDEMKGLIAELFQAGFSLQIIECYWLVL